MGRNTQITTGLLDTDIEAYRAAEVSTKGIAWDTEDAPEVVNLPAALKTAETIIKSWRRRVKASSYYMCFSSPVNFRKVIDPQYKSNRKAEDKPKVLEDLVAALKDRHPVLEIHGLEADDVMGIYATGTSIQQPVIVSIDKDMQSLPAYFYNPDKSDRPIKSSIQRANRFWMAQTLIGDVIDGYKGCPGIGPKKAEKILGDLVSKDMWFAVLDTYTGKGLTEEDAVRNARLARILRHSDWNPDTKEIRLWHPTQSTTLSTTTMGASKSSTSSSKSVPSTQDTKHPSSPTSSSTSVALPSKGKRRRTSRRRNGTSTGSSSR